ncbi:MAG: glycosyltransferase family 4 protein [Oscillospiraceae bacterium]|nr:glycosyltransferase family 4 protein [Oscillospiraceae bacterium]
MRSSAILDSLRKYGSSAVIDEIDASALFASGMEPSEMWMNIAPALRRADVVVVVLTSGINRSFFGYMCNEGIAAKSIGIIIGGTLADSIASKRTRYLPMLSFHTLLVQTDSLRRRLKEIGLTNVRVLHNFRTFDTNLLPNIRPRERLSRCVVYSRLVAEKGIETAVAAVRLFNKRREKPISLDLYGPVDTKRPEFYDWCMNLPKNEPIRYRGILDYHTAFLKLNEYDCLLFPTYFDGECFAGTIFEGFAAGLPIIATDWLYNSEFIQDGKNGFLVPIRRPDIIADKLELLADRDDLLNQMSVQSLASFETYREERVAPILYNAIEEILNAPASKRNFSSANHFMAARRMRRRNRFK